MNTPIEDDSGHERRRWSVFPAAFAPPRGAPRGHSHSIVNVARAFDIDNVLMAENGREDPPAERFLLSLAPGHGAKRLSLRDPGLADPQLLITCVTRCAGTFALTGTWRFQWAGLASNAVIDGFSGRAYRLEVGTGGTIEWISTSRWDADRGAR